MKAFSLGERWKNLFLRRMRVNPLATQDILTYCTTRLLPYYLYADEGELFVFDASLPSDIL